MTGSSEANPIPRITAADPAAGSGDVVAENVAALKSLFPAIVTDGRVDFDVLRQLLGDAVEDGEERYGLSWKGKRKARAFALTPTLATLRPAKAESKDWDSTQNIVIEGDNLEVLKCLHRSYAGQAKLIYIDPPYNTGNDFVYPDDYADSVGNYERLTGQRGADGAAMTTNKEASGRFHTDWLNMMFPRLMLAKELLRNDGVCAISTADNELENLLAICAELFGRENHLGTISVVTGANQSGDGVTVQKNVEYLVVYARNVNEVGIKRITPVAETLRALNDAPTPLHTRRDMGYTIYYNPDSAHWIPITDYPSHAVTSASDTSIYQTRSDLVDQGYQAIRPGLRRGKLHRWRWGVDTLTERAAEIVFRQMEDGWRPYFRQSGFNPPKNVWSFAGGAAELSDLFGVDDVFSYPKSTNLLKETVAHFGDDGITIDFFAGSGTTGHAVLAQNAHDGGNRRFILVQLPEPLDPANASQKTAADFCDALGKPRNIAELTKERLRRAGAKVVADNPGKPLDTGFRVYKLASSNLKPWAPDPDNLAASLLDSVDNIVPGRSEEDLLVELLLKTGIDLTLPMATRDIAGRTVHALGGGVLIVCLGDVTDADSEALGQGIADWHAELDPVRATTFYFRDSGFKTAAAKANVAAIIRQRVGARVERLASI